MLGKKAPQRSVNLWRISPPGTPTEVWQLRNILRRAAGRKEYFYLLTSLVCIMAAIINAASTSIANHTVVRNMLVQPDVIPGRIANIYSDGLTAAVITNMTSRIAALERAGVPPAELLDFIPDDLSNWVFVSREWDNAWKGGCTDSSYSDVDLTVTNANSSLFQDEVPLLGNYIPQWALANPANQGNFLSGFVGPDQAHFLNIVAYYVFGSAPPGPHYPNATMTNLALVNFFAQMFHTIIKPTASWTPVSRLIYKLSIARLITPIRDHLISPTLI
jgi:hypothetical protein